jgi:hypothetical protein
MYACKIIDTRDYLTNFHVEYFFYIYHHNDSIFKLENISKMRIHVLFYPYVPEILIAVW